MTASHRVAVLVGSLRKESYSRKLARALVDVMPQRLVTEFIEYRHLPLYDQDLEEAPPQTWLQFRAEIRRHDAILFVTPEYNRGLPGGLKNAIDVGSRPKESSVWRGKPAAVVSTSTGRLGGFGANHQLRQASVFLDMPIMLQPEAYVGGTEQLFDPHGELRSDEIRAFLVKLADAFAVWIDRTAFPR